MWFGEFKKLGKNSHWDRVNFRARKTQKSAKADCKKFLERNRNISHFLEFRTVTDNNKVTVYQESKPPYGERMKWK